jgi:hypothetical protein
MFAAAALLGAVALGASRSRLLVIPVVATALIVGLFDVFLEGVHAPIFLWLFVGLVLCQPDRGSRESISSNSST